MIKRLTTVVGMFILSAALIWAVWEGNAAVGTREEFPSGLFAASDLFPKHTLIEIVNLEQNTTSRAVIIANTGAGGLLLKASPELAAALAIKAGNTVRVRVSVPPLVEEEGADPMLISRKEEKKPAASQPVKQAIRQIPAPAARVAEEKPPVEVPVVREQPAESIPPPREVAEPKAPPKAREAAARTPAEVSEPVRPVAEKKVDTPPVAEVAEPVPPVKEQAAMTASVASVDAIVSLQKTAEPIEEESVRQVAAVSMSKGRVEADEEREAPAPERPTATQQPVAGVPAPEPPLYDTDDTIPEGLDIADEPEEFVSAQEVSPTEDPVPVLVEEEGGETSEPTDEPELFAVKTVEDNSAAAETPVEQTVMLVPAEPKEPVGEAPSIPKKDAQLAVAPVAQEKPPVVRPAGKPYTADVLKKGSFYVQVGRFRDSLNVESFVQRYGKQYPITVEKSSTPNGNFYRVYVGPLQKDERGAALETFQKLGFKDAFLKKAP